MRVNKNNANNFNTENIVSVNLNLLDGQVELILRALELYSYNLEYMLDGSNETNDYKQEKIAKLKYTYEQILATQAEQVNGKSIDNLPEIGKKIINNENITAFIPNNEDAKIG